MADNEEALCEALIRLLEGDLEAERSDVTYPETDHSGPPVQMRLRLGAQRFAIEHTLIEPFPQAIQTGKWFHELTEEIEAGLNGVMPPPGTYRLVFPIHPTEGKPRRTHAALRERIMQWVREAGEALRDERQHGVQQDRAAQQRGEDVATAPLTGGELGGGVSVAGALSGDQR